MAACSAQRPLSVGLLPDRAARIRYALLSLCFETLMRLCAFVVRRFPAVLRIVAGRRRPIPTLSDLPPRVPIGRDCFALRTPIAKPSKHLNPDVPLPENLSRPTPILSLRPLFHQLPPWPTTRPAFVLRCLRPAGWPIKPRSAPLRPGPQTASGNTESHVHKSPVTTTGRSGWRTESAPLPCPCRYPDTLIPCFTALSCFALPCLILRVPLLFSLPFHAPLDRVASLLRRIPGHID